MPAYTVSENILFFICGLGILQGFLLSALIFFHPKGDKSVNKFLAVYILCITAVMTMPIAIDIIGWQNSYIIMSVPSLPPIFLYLYILSFKKTITWQIVLPHFIIVFVILLLAYINLSAIAKIYPDAKHIPPEGLKRPLTLIVIGIRTIQQFFYYFLSLKTLKSYQQSIQHLFSDTSRIDLHWARFLANGFIVLICAFIVIFPLMISYPNYFDLLLLLNMAIATPYIYIATYKGIMQSAIWQIQPEMKREKIEEELQQAEKIEMQITNSEKNKPAKTTLSQDKINHITQKIVALMEQEKLYQETELTLQQLADKLQTPTYQVSQAINEGLKKNFYDLINGYRVEDAKRLLQDPKSINYTILSIGFDAGFNSKTTFNTVFKKFTGVTPTEFKNKNKMMTIPA